MRFFIAILIGCSMIGCDQERDLPLISASPDYYPIEIGQFRTYWVEEVTFSLLDPDTSRYLLREVIADSLINPEGVVRYLIHRYVADDSITFKLDSVWSVYKTGQSVVVTENNIPFVKLIQPVDRSRTWDGNAFNRLSSLTYYFQESTIHPNVTVDLTSRDLIDVILEDIPANLVNQDERRETYAAGIGLVQKDYVTLGFCTLDCRAAGEIQSGRVLRQWLVEYGNL
ncbi:MAG: hypothetical protein JXR10_01505 [Cyclobacteriaceae bacterium]